MERKIKLIDVDKLENDIVENITGKSVSRMLAIVQGQPTITAIPMEWISEYTRKPISSADYWAVVRLVLSWEKRE